MSELVVLTGHTYIDSMNSRYFLSRFLLFFYVLYIVEFCAIEISRNLPSRNQRESAKAMIERKKARMPTSANLLKFAVFFKNYT